MRNRNKSSFTTPPFINWSLTKNSFFEYSEFLFDKKIRYIHIELCRLVFDRTFWFGSEVQFNQESGKVRFGEVRLGLLRFNEVR